ATSTGTATFNLPATSFVALMKQADQPAANSCSGLVPVPEVPGDESLTSRRPSMLREMPPSRPPVVWVLVVYRTFSSGAIVRAPFQVRLYAPRSDLNAARTESDTARLRSGYRCGIHIRGPGGMEAEGHANRKADPRHRLTVEILSVQDHDVAQVALRIVDAAHDPALVLGDRARLFHENRLQGHLTGTEIMDLGRPVLEVMLHRRTATEKSSVVVSRISIAVGLPPETA